MGRLIKNVRGRNIVEFDKGDFDEWCVYLTRFRQNRYAPRDTEYFSIIKQKAILYSCEKIYNDFLKIYYLTSGTVETKILFLISEISDTYGRDAEEMDIWFSVIYGGMIAEENKQYAILKKRIKRLGLHQILKEDLSPEFAADFSRGKNWKELDVLMKGKGF